MLNLESNYFAMLKYKAQSDPALAVHSVNGPSKGKYGKHVRGTYSWPQEPLRQVRQMSQ